MARLCVVTGALGYSGRAIAERLIGRGDVVRTLTNSPRRPNPFGEKLQIRPLAFEDRAGLVESLRGVDVLFNTYWVRFNHKLFTFEGAVANTMRLFAAAKEAGVGRIVHVSILKPEQGKGLAYYEGKLQLEGVLKGLGVPHAIVRPGVLFGRGDILVNNIAWALRRLPVFGVFGDGRYKLQPMHVDDLAEMMVACGDEAGSFTRDAVGPEVFAYRQLAREVAKIIGVRRPVVSVWPWLGYGVTKAINPLVGDVIITREEVEGLMRGLLFSDAAPPVEARTKLTEWAKAHREELGRRYASEVGRRMKRDVGYERI